MAEEIIIDGVDVSGCNFRLERDNKQKCECCHATGFGVICDCEAWHNCHYKQTQRLKAENDKFKNFVKDLLFDVSCENWLERFIFSFNDWKKEMVSENEKLKAEIEEIKKIKDDFFKQAEISHQAVLDKNKIIEELEAENEKLKAELQELKEKHKRLTCKILEIRALNQTLVANCKIDCEQLLKYTQTLEEIRKVINEPCIKGGNCLTCNSNCMQKEILNKISEVIK